MSKNQLTEAQLSQWAIYTQLGRVPADMSFEEIESIGDTKVRVRDVTALINASVHKERKLIEQLIDDNGVKDIILQDKLGVTQEDYETAKKTRAKELADFEKQMQAQWALAQEELAKKQLKGE